MTRVRSTFWPSLAAAAAIHGALALWLVTRQPAISKVLQIPSRVRLVTRDKTDGRQRATGWPRPARPALDTPRPPRTPAPRKQVSSPPILPAAVVTSPPVPLAHEVPLEELSVAPVPQEAKELADSGESTRRPQASDGPSDVADGSGGGRGYTFDSLDETPLVLRRPGKWDLLRYYPKEELKAGREADVKVELTVDVTGTVIDVKILEGAGPSFDAAARKLGPLMQFTPARRGGRPVKTRAYIVFNFVIEKI